MPRAKPLITDNQWERIEPLLPDLNKGKKPGRPWTDNRACFEGILWVLKTGARWRDLPEHYPSPSTCWRRLKLWEEQGIWENAWRQFLRELDLKGLLDWDEAFIDATFHAAKRGASMSGRQGKAREPKSCWWPMAEVFRSEFSPRLRTLTKALSPSQRSELYAFLAQPAGDPEPNPNA